MTSGEPPSEVHYDLDESFEPLVALEDAAGALAESDHLAVVAEIEHQIAVLSRKLSFDHPFGGEDGR